MRILNTLATTGAIALLAGAPALASEEVTTGPPTYGDDVTSGPPTNGEVEATGAGPQPFDRDRNFTRDERGFIYDESGRKLMGEEGRPVTESTYDYYEEEGGRLHVNRDGEAILKDDAPEFEVAGDGGVTVEGSG